MNEWQKLQARYSSNRRYAARKVFSSQNHFHDFIEFLIGKGADISNKPSQDEALRFFIGQEIGIVYNKGSGNLLAHDMGLKYQQSINDPIEQDYSLNFSFQLDIYR